MPIRELFHVMHMVDDFDAAAERFEQLFAPHVYAPKHWSDLDKRWASLANIGPDFVLELMEASKDPAHAASPLPKFVARFGHHLHSWSWLVDDADQPALFHRLRAGGVRIAGQHGLVPTDAEVADEDVPRVMFSHPKDTLGQIEFMATGTGGRDDPRFQPGWSGDFWRDEHPMGILRTSHVTNTVADMDHARRVFVDLLDGVPFLEETTSEKESLYVLVGKETVVELARPTVTGGTLLADDLAANGPLSHSVTFQVKDLDAAGRHAEAVGVRVRERSGDTLTLEPADTFDGIYSLTTATLANDPRDA